MTDLRPVLADIERTVAQAPKRDRHAMAVLHILFNISVPEECRSPNCDTVHEALQQYLDTLSAEALVLLCYAIDPAELWDLQVHREGHDDFFKKRSKPSGLQVPRLFEAAISLTLAERYRSVGDIEQSRALLAFAVNNYPGHAGLLAAEHSFMGDEALSWRKILLPNAVDVPREDAQEAPTENGIPQQ